jgi:hypothetical protein
VNSNICSDNPVTILLSAKKRQVTLIIAAGRLSYLLRFPKENKRIYMPEEELLPGIN